MFLFNVYIVRLITASHFPMVHLGLMQFYNLIWVEAKSRKRSKIWTFPTTLLQSVCWSDFIISLSVFPKTVILLARKQLGGYILILQKIVKVLIHEIKWLLQHTVFYSLITKRKRFWNKFIDACWLQEHQNFLLLRYEFPNKLEFELAIKINSTV